MTDPQKGLENPSLENDSNVNKIDSIKANLTDIKNSVEDVNRKIEYLDKNKKTLVQQEIAVRQKEIDEKKLEIDRKKKETEELIKQARALADLEQDITITNEIRKELDSYEKQLNEIQPQSSSFWEKIKNVGGKTVERIKDHPWQTAGIGLLVAGAIYLFRRKKNKKEDVEGSDGDKKEKKGFWKTGFGKFLKWTGIGVAGFFGIRRLWNKFGNKDKDEDADNHDENQNQVEEYKNFIEKYPEKAEKYEKFGEGVDGLYGNIFAKEIENGREDAADMNTISQELGESYPLKGLVPFCMDNSFGSVDSMLSEWGIEVDLYQKDFVAIKTKVLSRLKSKTGGALKLFLGALPSWAQFGIGNTLEEKFEKWMESDPEARVSELKSFFRQQMRVTVFLKTKEGELVKAIAQEKFKTDKGDFEDPDEALDDSDWFEKNIKNDQDYKSFRSGNIINANDILKKYNLMNGEMNENTADVVKECDHKRDDILDGNDGDDIIKRCETDINDGSLESTNKEKLVKSCDKITDDIVDLEEVASNQAIDMYRKFFNTEHANKEELLKQSTILPLLQEIRKNIPGLKDKINNGEMKAEDIKSLKEFMNNYFALKKELAIGVNVYEMIKSEDGSTVITFTKLFEDMFKNMGKGFAKLFKGEIFSGLGWLLTGSAPIALIAGGLFMLKKYPGTTLKYTLLSPVIVPSKLYQASLWTAKKIGGKYYGPSGSLRRMFFNESDGPQKLLNELKKGNISLQKAQEIVDGSQVRTMPKIKDRRAVDLFTKDVNLKKSTLLKKAFSNITRSDDERKLLAKYFDNKTFNNLVINNFDESLRLAKLYESKLSTLSVKQVKFFELITDFKRFSGSDLENLIKNIDKINLDDIQEKHLSKLARELSKNKSAFSNVDEINDLIKNSLKIKDVVTNTDKFAYKIWQFRDGNVNDFMKNFDTDGKFAKYSHFKQRYLNVAGNANELAKLDYEFAEKLIKDGVKFEDVFELSVDQKNLIKLVDDDLLPLRKAFDSTSNRGLKANYSRQISSLEDMKLNKIPYFGVDEFKKIETLKGLKFKPRYMAEIFDMIDNNKQFIMEGKTIKIAEIMEKGDIDEIINVLRKGKSELGVSDELIEFLSKEKNFIMKSFKFAVGWIKQLFKFIAKLR